MRYAFMCKFKRVLLYVMLYGIWLPNILKAQRTKRIDKNYFAIDLDAGLSYADYDEILPYWKPTFYSAISLDLVWNLRMNARIDLDLGVGGTFLKKLHLLR